MLIVEEYTRYYRSEERYIHITTHYAAIVDTVRTWQNYSIRVYRGNGLAQVIMKMKLVIFKNEELQTHTILRYS